MAVFNGVNFPDFFIVGAPKCGTTSMHYYLQQHPQVFMAAKELHFFGKDFTYREAPTPESYYLSFFKDASFTQSIGEASVWYLFSKKAAQEIKSANPNAKIIIMLRNPVDMIYSLHSEQYYNGNENIASFEKALQTEELRLLGKHIPLQIGCPIEALQYRQVGLYYEQINRYLKIFGKANVHCILLKDLKENPKTSFCEVLNFLQLNKSVSINYDIQNKNKVARSHGLTTLLRNRSKLFVSLVKTIIPSRKWRHQIQNLLWKWNAKTVERPAMSSSLKTELSNYFLKDIEQLEILLDRDLNDWKL